MSEALIGEVRCREDGHPSDVDDKPVTRIQAGVVVSDVKA